MQFLQPDDNHYLISIDSLMSSCCLTQTKDSHCASGAEYLAQPQLILFLCYSSLLPTYCGAPDCSCYRSQLCPVAFD